LPIWASTAYFHLGLRAFTSFCSRAVLFDPGARSWFARVQLLLLDFPVEAAQVLRCSVFSFARASRSVTDSRFSPAVRCLPPGFGPLARFSCRCSPDARSLLRSPDCCCCSGQVSRSSVFGFAGQLLLISVSASPGSESAAPEFCFQHWNSVRFASVLFGSAF
jgi:hypothetical protein